MAITLVIVREHAARYRLEDGSGMCHGRFYSLADCRAAALRDSAGRIPVYYLDSHNGIYQRIA